MFCSNNISPSQILYSLPGLSGKKKYDIVKYNKKYFFIIPGKE